MIEAIGYILYVIACWLLGYYLGYLLGEYLNKREWAKEFPDV